MSKHFTINIRVNEVTEAVADTSPARYGKEATPRKVEETADVTVRASTKEEALEKLAVIIPAL